jgi:hypothetical protein
VLKACRRALRPAVLRLAVGFGVRFASYPRLRGSVYLWTAHHGCKCVWLWWSLVAASLPFVLHSVCVRESVGEDAHNGSVRRYDNFSDHDFELFIADLLGAELGMRFEAFPRGADGGVDLRFSPGKSRRPHVVQCKHYAGSSFSALLTAAGREASRLASLKPQPKTYRFVTSQPLTAKRKAKLAVALKPWIRDDSDVIGAHDLELLFDRHADVERRQVKLWLTGGTQLAALLRSGTIARSQSLLDEIERALPRYVQGEVFADARKQLRTEHVLVIAGVPGIGKTTLARMLLADAVLDGYEPIEVSHDIEEAWELVDDGVKQVFLYDDFLGRTALAERFAKNEDRRLIDFMRRAARRRSTLFVLTTREYILRQAAQLYERLEQESLEGRRFLLELRKYSRVDRARIFANHAYHSEQMTPAAKQAVLSNRAYERVIDHPGYNPRTIEWVTGMATGHRLSGAELAGYVTFVVESLSHPERIWKHAFEREIDASGRALLFALATLPPSVELEHLERAFEGSSQAMGLPLGGRAFERTLAALDDSFVRTAHDDAHWRNRGILVRAYDASVIDFLRDYLRRSPGDAVSVIKGAVFFEQVEWLLSALAVDGGPPPENLAADLSAATMRTFDAPGIRVVRVPVPPNAWTERARGTRDVEARLLATYRMRAAGLAWESTLSSWWRSTFEARVDQWRQGTGEPPSLLKLLEAVDAEDVDDFEAALEAAKSVMRSGWSYVQTCEWLIEMRALFPEAFAIEEWAHVADEFANWIENDLTSSAQDMSTEDELAAVERVAEELGVPINEEELDFAQEAVQQNIAEHESEIDPDPDWEPGTRSHDVGAERREIEAIFIRLAES